MTNLGTWLSIIGLSMTPGLILGPSAAVGVGFEAHYNPWAVVIVVALANYIEGLALVWLIRGGTQIALIHRWVERMRTPKALGFAKNWGVWGGLTLGRAIVGQEPILVGLELLGIELRRLYVPLAVSCLIFTYIYYIIVSFGLNQLGNL